VPLRNYDTASALGILERHGEAKTLLKKTIPAAQRVLGPSHEFTFRMMGCYAAALCNDTGATLDDLREAETTLEETERTALRVFGSAHPLTTKIELALQQARAVLSAREPPTA